MNEVVRIPLAPVPDPHPVVRLKGFSRSFGDTKVLTDLDLAIAPGEFVALLGRSGSGKTTLLRTLAGLDDRDEQDVVVPPSRATVFQDARLLPWKKVWQNVALGLAKGAPRHHAEQALREVGLAHRLPCWRYLESRNSSRRTRHQGQRNHRSAQGIINKGGSRAALFSFGDQYVQNLA